MKFITKPNDWLFCVTCKAVADHATQLACCGKLFCKSCLEDLRTTSPGLHCPMCRKARYQFFEDPRSNSIIATLRVNCPNGCPWQGELQKVAMHLDPENLTSKSPGGQGLFACPLQAIYCPYKSMGCTAKPQRKDMDQHIADNQNQHLQLTMELVSQLQLKTSALEETVKKQTAKIAEHETRF